jgi:hypothetical protein
MDYVYIDAKWILQIIRRMYQVKWQASHTYVICCNKVPLPGTGPIYTADYSCNLSGIAQYWYAANYS